MTINQITKVFYEVARALRWVKAGQRSVNERSFAPIAKRAGRVVAGRVAGQYINRLFR